MAKALRYRGSAEFRFRLVLATLSNRPVVVEGIRDKDEKPDFEVNLLRLLDKVTNGTKIEINETGTRVRLVPGVLMGGSYTHDCGTSRGIGYFVEALLLLGPFGKKNLRVALTGITNHPDDLGVDTLRSVTLPCLRHFGLEEGLTLQLKRRGLPPKGGGLVLFSCPAVRELRPVHFTFEGFVKRIRGLSCAAKVFPQVTNRVVESARGLLNRFIPDVYIATDHVTGKESGLSSGFAVSLVAESTAGCLYGVEGTARPGQTPEDLGRDVARLLCDEIARGGSVDTITTPLLLVFMALTPEDVSRLRVGKLSRKSIAVLRLLKDFFGITFKLTPEPRGTVRQKRPGTELLTVPPPKRRRRRSAAAAGAGQEVEGEEGEEEAEEEKEEADAVARARRAALAAAGVDEEGFVHDAGEIEVAQSETVLVSCVGVGFKNLAKKVT